MKTRKLKSLGLDEAIKVNTLAQAKYFIDKLDWNGVKPQQLVGNYICQEDEGYFVWTDFLSCSTEYPASDFIKPKKSKFKKLEKRVEALEKSQKNTKIKLSTGLECDAHKERTDTEKMEDGVWYKNEMSLFLYKSTGYTYGFALDKWIGKLFMAYHHVGDNTVKATPEEVESAFIKEAEKRGFGRPGNNFKILENSNVGIIPEDCDFSYDFSCNFLLASNYLIFHNGKWAEILPNEEETIDWSKAGQLLESKNYTVVITDGINTDTEFAGTCLSKNEEGIYIGEYGKDWFKKAFKPFKGQLTLKNE